MAAAIFRRQFRYMPLVYIVMQFHRSAFEITRVAAQQRKMRVCRSQTLVAAYILAYSGGCCCHFPLRKLSPCDGCCMLYMFMSKPYPAHTRASVTWNGAHRTRILYYNYKTRRRFEPPQKVHNNPIQPDT